MPFALGFLRCDFEFFLQAFFFCLIVSSIGNLGLVARKRMFLMVNLGKFDLCCGAYSAISVVYLFAIYISLNMMSIAILKHLHLYSMRPME